VNPVLAREVKERMRGLWAFVALMVFLGLLTLTVWLVYEANHSTDPFSFDLERQTRLGRDLFEWVLGIMVLLVCFLVPGLTAGAVAGERERQTLLPLQITLLTPRQILWGKVMASLAYLVLMVVAAIPIFAVAYQLGGVSLADIGTGLLGVVVVGVLVATMVVGISSFAKRVQTATLLAYGFVFVLLLAGFVAYGAAAVVDANRGVDATDPPGALLLPNPIVFLADVTSGENVDVGSSPLQPVRQLLADAYSDNDGWFAWGDGTSSVTDQPVDGGGVFVSEPDQNPFGPTRPAGTAAWVWSLGSMTVLALGLFLLGCRRLRTPAEVER
jgi:ABC-type transport system involved in multi-copper enzyme maturation permease subunit